MPIVELTPRISVKSGSTVEFNITARKIEVSGVESNIANDTCQRKEYLFFGVSKSPNQGDARNQPASNGRNVVIIRGRLAMFISP